MIFWKVSSNNSFIQPGLRQIKRVLVVPAQNLICNGDGRVIQWRSQARRSDANQAEQMLQTPHGASSLGLFIQSSHTDLAKLAEWRRPSSGWESAENQSF